MFEESQSSLITPIGFVILREEREMICGVEILPPGVPSPDITVSEKPVLLRAKDQLEEYFAGKRTKFLLPLKFPAWQPFSLRVLDALCTVPYGETRTYGELAALACSPHAARAVGQVMAANPLPIFFPCHRVVAAGGLPGGYSGGGGLLTKKWLLDFERTQHLP